MGHEREIKSSPYIRLLHHIRIFVTLFTCFGGLFCITLILSFIESPSLSVQNIEIAILFSAIIVSLIGCYCALLGKISWGLSIMTIPSNVVGSLIALIIVLIVPSNLSMHPLGIGIFLAQIVAALTIPYIFMALKNSREGITHPLRENTTHPPELETYILSYFLPEEYREDMLGDLEEEFQGKQVELGNEGANQWYRQQVRSTFYQFLLDIGRKIIRWVI